MKREGPVGATPQSPAAPRKAAIGWCWWLALFILSSTAAIGLGQLVWDGPSVVVCAGLGIVLSAISRWLRVRTSQPIPRIRALANHSTLSTACAALSLALFLVLVSRSSWLAGEITLGGRDGTILRSCLASILGATLGGAALILGRRWDNAGIEGLRRGLLGVLMAVATIGLGLFVVLTGPRDLTRYPVVKESPYRLPWRAGVRRLCVQGNRAIVSHRDWEEFAYDFAMPVGSDVCAARGGFVVLVEMSHDGNGFGLPNNQIAIAHDDGSFGYYLHLKKCGNYVNVSDRVEQGQRIAASGNVGLSMLPHLHFQVMGASGQLLPVTFAEVSGDGIPRMFWRYTSDNAPPHEHR
jgi:hypothetical protein